MSTAVVDEAIATRALFLRMSAAAGNARDQAKSVLRHPVGFRSDYIDTLTDEADRLTRAEALILAALTILEAK